VGPHSTGKTTLARAIKGHYGDSIHILEETARGVLKAKGYKREDIETGKCFQMQVDILKAQFSAENSIFAKHGAEVHFISDRAGIDPILYTMKYCPGEDAWKELCELEEWKLLATRYRETEHSIVILIEPTPEFMKDDGTRKLPTSFQEWLAFNEMYKTFLTNQNIPFKTIGPECLELQSRVEKVVNWVNGPSLILEVLATL